MRNPIAAALSLGQFSLLMIATFWTLVFRWLALGGVIALVLIALTSLVSPAMANSIPKTCPSSQTVMQIVSNAGAQKGRRAWFKLTPSATEDPATNWSLYAYIHGHPVGVLFTSSGTICTRAFVPAQIIWGLMTETEREDIAKRADRGA